MAFFAFSIFAWPGRGPWWRTICNYTRSIGRSAAKAGVQDKFDKARKECCTASVPVPVAVVAAVVLRASYVVAQYAIDIADLFGRP